jgi:hypothetical protein
MTFRGYRTTRTFRSIKNGNPVDSHMTPNPAVNRTLRIKPRKTGYLER